MLLVMRIYHDNLVNNRSDLIFNNDLETHGKIIRHDVRSRVSSKLVVVTIGNTEGVEGLS